MLLAFAFVFASCSNGSDSDDDDSSTNGKPSSDSSTNGKPSSVGENVLAGNSYQYSQKDDKKTKTITYVFKDDTVTETEVKQPTGESPETEITEYKYTCNANTGLLYLNIVSWTVDGEKMTSMDDVYKYFAKDFDCTVEEAKEQLGDENMFAENISVCYFVKDDGNILLGDYFDDDKDVEVSKFVYAEDAALRVNFDGEKMTSMDDVYKYFAKDFDCTVEEAKEQLGDENMFAENISVCYFVKDDGNILLGDYFDDDKDVEVSKFVYAEDAALRVNFDGEKIELNVATKASWKIELDAKAQTFSGKEIEGSYTVKEKATKTLKDLNGYDKSNEANGYITIKFSKLPATLTSEPYNMKTGTEYKFIFDPDCDEYKKL